MKQGIDTITISGFDIAFAFFLIGFALTFGYKAGLEAFKAIDCFMELISYWIACLVVKVKNARH